MQRGLDTQAATDILMALLLITKPRVTLICYGHDTLGLLRRQSDPCVSLPLPKELLIFLNDALK